MNLPTHLQRLLLFLCFALVFWNRIATSSSMWTPQKSKAFVDGSLSHELNEPLTSLGEEEIASSTRGRQLSSLEPIGDREKGQIPGKDKPALQTMSWRKIFRVKNFKLNWTRFFERMKRSFEKLWTGFTTAKLMPGLEPSIDIHPIAAESPILKELLVTYKANVKKGQRMSQSALHEWLTRVEDGIWSEPVGSEPLDKKAQIAMGLNHLARKLSQKAKGAATTSPMHEMLKSVEDVQIVVNIELQSFIKALSHDARTSLMGLNPHSQVKAEENKLLGLALKVGLAREDVQKGKDSNEVAEFEAQGLASISRLGQMAQEAGQKDVQERRMASLRLLSLVANPVDEFGTPLYFAIESWKTEANKVLKNIVDSVLKDRLELRPFDEYIIQTEFKNDYAILSEYMDFKNSRQTHGKHLSAASLAYHSKSLEKLLGEYNDITPKHTER